MKSILFAFAALLCSFTAYADGVSFTFTSLPGTASKINNNGQIAGYTQSGGIATGYIDTNGTIAPVVTPYTSLVTSYTGLGINDAGSVVGQATVINSSGYPTLTTAFEANNGTVTPITGSGPAGGIPQPFAINDSGQIVGFYSGANTAVGFIDTNGVFTNLSVPNALGGTIAEGLNNSGRVVGFYYGSNNLFDGFLYTNGVYQTISDPLGLETYATGINDSGDLTGFYFTATSENGFIDVDGVFTTVDAPGSTATEIYGINDSDELVGEGNGYGSFAAIAPVPTPEPSSMLLLGVGLVGLLAVRRQQQGVNRQS